jgi:ribosomal protein S18 acetylase RimI-like enzyme
MLRGFEEGYAIPSFGILIDHRYHNIGLGRHLLALTVDQAKEMGCQKVRLSVYGINQAGYKIYKELGFQEIERSIINRHGTPDEKIIMVKDLL